MRRSVVRLGLFAIAVVAIVTAALIGAVHTPSVRGRALTWISARVSRDFGIVIQSAGLRYNLLSLSAELETPTLLVQGERPFLIADVVRVALTPGTVLGRVGVARLELDRPRFAIVRHRDGRTNLPVARSASSSPSPLHVGILTLKQARIDVEDEGGARRLTSGPLDLTLDTRTAKPPPGAFGPNAFALTIGAPDAGSARTVSGTLGGRLAFDGVRLTIADFRVESPEARVSLRGAVDVVAETIGVEADGRLETDLARAGRLFGAAASSLRGSIAADLTVRGSVSDPTIHVVLDGQHVRYRSSPEVALAAAATYAGGALDVERLGVTSDAGDIAANGRLSLTSSQGSVRTSRVNARLTNVDLDRMLDALDVTRPVRAGSLVSGAVEVAADLVDGLPTDWWRHLNGGGSLRLTPSQTGLSLDGSVDLGVHGDRWTADSDIRSTHGTTSLSGSLAGQTREGGRGVFEDATLSGDIRARVEDLRGLMAFLRAQGTVMTPALDEIGGDVDAHLRVGGTIASPRVSATVAGRRIHIRDLPDGEFDSDVVLDRRSASASSVRVRLATIGMTGSGTYAWAGQVEGRFEATAPDLADVARLTGAEASVAGSARLAGSIQGDVRAPRARAELIARDLAASEVSIGSVTGIVQLADRRLEVDVAAPDLSTNVRGAIDLAEPFPFQLQANLERSPLAAFLPASVRSSVSADGTITATVRGAGTARQPLETTGELSLMSLDANVSGVPIVLETPAVIAVERNAIRTAPVRLHVGRDSRVRMQGVLGLNDVREGLDVNVAGSLDDLIDAVVRAAPDTRLRAERSRVDLQLHVGGTLRAPDPVGTLAIDAALLRYADVPPLGDVALAARIERTRVVLQSLAATWQEARLRAEGMLPFRLLAPAPSPDRKSGIAAWGSGWLASLPVEPKSLTLAASVTGISTKALAPFVDAAKLQSISGSAAAAINAEADGFRVDRVRGSVVLDQAAVTLAGVPFAQVVPTRVSLEGGRARIDELRWAAQGNELRVFGGADFAASAPTLDLGVDGAFDLRILAAFVPAIGSGGIARPTLTVKGPLASPEILGSIGISAGELRIDAPALAASDLEGRIAVGTDRMANVALKGLVNGGAATVDGTLDLRNLAVPSGRISLTARDVPLEYPAGFQTESNAALTLALAAGAPTLSGRIDVSSGVYREPLVVSRSLLAGFGGRGASADSGSSFLTKLALDLAVTTTEDVRIDNNYGRLDVAAKLQVTGTAAQPGAIGRVEAQPDGEIYLAGNTYRIRSFVVDFANPRSIAPEVSFLADTRVSNVPIEIALQCASTSSCERDVRSESPGVTNEQAEALLFGISADSRGGAQLARLLSGELLGIVGQTMRLDTLRLEQGTGRADLFDDPTLVAGDVNPASRLTIGKRLGENVEVAYSQNLAENGFTTSTSYSGPAGTSFRALLLDDESRSFEFRHEPRLGGRRRAAPTSRRAGTISAVRFVGDPGFPDSELHGHLRAREGRRFDFAEWRADRDRLIAFYQKSGFFEARVRARRLRGAGEPAISTPSASPVDDLVLEYAIERGRPTRLDVSGFELPDEIRQRVVDRWTTAVFDDFLERDAALIAREYLARTGRLQARATAAIRHDAADNGKTLTITIDPGPVTTPRLVFEGNSRIPTATLVDLAQRAGPLAAWLDPAAVAEVIKREYEDNGFLSVEVRVSPPEIQQDASVIRVVVREGEPWLVGKVSVGGGDVLPEASGKDAELVSGTPYTTKLVGDRAAALEQRFRDAGFLGVRVTTEAAPDRPVRRVDVRIVVEPGPRSVLAGVSVDGAPPDSAIVSRNVKLMVGQPVSAAAMSATRRGLYQSGAYGSVEIDLEPAEAITPKVDGVDIGPTEQSVVARIRVEERPRYRFRYGLAFNDTVVAGADERDRRIGFAADLENHNVLGTGATVGVSARLRRDQEVGRVFFGASRFFGLPIRSNVFFSRSRQEIGSADVTTVSDVTEFSAEQTYRVRRSIDVRYGYSLGRNLTTIEALDLDLAVRVARMTVSALVDRRSDPFDPSRGWFSAANFELSRPGLGSELSFARTFLQQFQFVPIGRGIVIASAARVGLARTFRGETLIPSERFFGGGATSVRGYADNSLGPRGILGDAEGGAGLFLANGEIRFPVYKWLKGVGFVDVGNVYPFAGDILRTRTQAGAGAGIRLNTPVGLFRLDLGVPLNGRELDSGWTTHFGLGHAF